MKGNLTMAEPKPMLPEDRASDEFNALPIEERKRICNFMNMERIRELQRQKRLHRGAIADIDESIRRQREWMYRTDTQA